METASEALEQVHHDLSQAGLATVWARSGALLMVPCRVLGQEAVLRVTSEGRRCYLRLTTPFVAAPEQRGAAARAVCEINWQLPLGAFLLDPASGQLSYRIGEFAERGRSGVSWPELVAACIGAMEGNFPRFLERVTAIAREDGDFMVGQRGHRLSAALRPSPRERITLGNPGVFLQDMETRAVHALLERDARTGRWLVKPVRQGALVEEEAVDADAWLEVHGLGLEAVLTSQVREPELEASLRALQCVPRRVELMVERSLRTRLPTVELGVTPHETTAYPEALIARALSSASDEVVGMLSGINLRRPGAAWTVWELDGAAVGVSVWTAMDESGLGVVDFIGLLPEHRGRKLGTAVHAATLHRLAQAGLATYRDATQGDNLAMQRIFFKNGCQLSGFLVYFDVGRRLFQREQR